MPTHFKTWERKIKGAHLHSCQTLILKKKEGKESEKKQEQFL